MALFVSGPVNGWMRGMIKIAIIKFQLRRPYVTGCCVGKKHQRRIRLSKKSRRLSTADTHTHDSNKRAYLLEARPQRITRRVRPAGRFLANEGISEKRVRLAAWGQRAQNKILIQLTFGPTSPPWRACIIWPRRPQIIWELHENCPSERAR
jgi:hypothetical protein